MPTIKLAKTEQLILAQAEALRELAQAKADQLARQANAAQHEAASYVSNALAALAESHGFEPIHGHYLVTPSAEAGGDPSLTWEVTPALPSDTPSPPAEALSGVGKDEASASQLASLRGGKNGSGRPAKKATRSRKR